MNLSDLNITEIAFNVVPLPTVFLSLGLVIGTVLGMFLMYLMMRPEVIP